MSIKTDLLLKAFASGEVIIHEFLLTPLLSASGQSIRTLQGLSTFFIDAAYHLASSPFQDMGAAI